MSEIYKALATIQQKLNAPKGQFNKFGKYAYRNCEDILEALKPLLGDFTVTLTDSIEVMGNRFYVKATAKLQGFDGECIEVSAFARECDNKKGMDDAQLTGATSSYARKYALNGLFLIDDNKDADSQDNSEPKQSAPKDIQEVIDTRMRLANNDFQWVKDNWDGVVAKAWNYLTVEETDKLNNGAT